MHAIVIPNHSHSEQRTLIDEVALLVSVTLTAPEQNIEFAQFRDDTVHFALILLLERHVVVLGALPIDCCKYRSKDDVYLLLLCCGFVLSGSFGAITPTVSVINSPDRGGLRTARAPSQKLPFDVTPRPNES